MYPFILSDIYKTIRYTNIPSGNNSQNSPRYPFIQRHNDDFCRNRDLLFSLHTPPFLQVLGTQTSIKTKALLKK